MKSDYVLLAALVAGSPAPAKWNAVPASAPVQVAGDKLTVAPSAGWNRWSKRPAKQTELWSFDGPMLNQLQFYSLAAGMPLARERNKKREPLPKFSPRMKATDVAEAFEGTIRVSQGVSDFAIDSIEPATFAGSPGFRFVYHYTSGELLRKGEARGAIVGGKLHLISYNAPSLYYYDAHLSQAVAVMESAKLN